MIIAPFSFIIQYLNCNLRSEMIMVKYEYKVLNVKTEKITKSIVKDHSEYSAFLSDLGSEGWRLINERVVSGL